MLLVLAVGGAKAEDKITQIAISGTTDNMTVECLDANLDPLDPQPATPQYPAKFTPTGDFKRILQYENFEVGDNDAIVVEFGGEVPDGWNINGYVNGKNASQSFESIAGYGTTQNPKYVMNLSGLSGNIVDFTIFNWQGYRNPIIVKDVYFIKYDDPLKTEKNNLQAAIATGNAQNPFAKTAASFQVLTDAITAGEAELVNASATSSSLTNAKNAINEAIAGLKLQDGYTKLTSAMFKAHASTAIDAAITGDAGCSYVINEASDLPYGDVSVGEKNWADLAEFSQFIAISANDIPRFCMNRMEAGANHNDNKAEAKFVDINANNASWWEVVDYLTINEGKYSVDLAEVVKDFGVARLHCIKGKAYQVKTTLTDMLLYRTITVGEKGLATFGSLTKNAKPNGVKAYAAVYNSVTGKVDLEEVTNVPAGKGVIIEAVEGSYAPTFDVAAADIESDLKVSNGTVVGDGKTIYVLNKVGGNVGFYKLAKDSPVGAGKAYLVIPETNARGFIGIDGMELTGVNEVNVNKAVAKTGKIYNLNGQIVSKPTKGLYIVDGKVVSF